jgi:hypothetical protein
VSGAGRIDPGSRADAPPAIAGGRATGRGSVLFAQRHECKFTIPESVAARVFAQAAPFLAPDPHAATRPDHSYPISSLYLDGADLPLYRETVEGQHTRFKLRVRSYSDSPSMPLFLEIKRRIGGVVTKSRCPVARGALPTLLGGDIGGFDHLAPQKRRTLEEFVRLVALKRARPRILVRYDRAAWVGADDHEVRLTFDRQLRVLASARAEVPVDHSGFVAVPLAGTLMELKFTNRCPPWMLDIVRRFELRRRSFSKYGNCVERIGLQALTSLA